GPAARARDTPVLEVINEPVIVTRPTCKEARQAAGIERRSLGSRCKAQHTSGDLRRRASGQRGDQLADRGLHVNLGILLGKRGAAAGEFDVPDQAGWLY